MDSGNNNEGFDLRKESEGHKGNNEGLQVEHRVEKNRINESTDRNILKSKAAEEKYSPEAERLTYVSSPLPTASLSAPQRAASSHFFLFVTWRDDPLGALAMTFEGTVTSGR